MSVRIIPLAHHVAVRLDAVPETTAGGLHKVESRSPMRWAEVVSVGEFCRLVRIGEQVLLNSLSGTEVGGLLVVPEQAIVARRS